VIQCKTRKKGELCHTQKKIAKVRSVIFIKEEQKGAIMPTQCKEYYENGCVIIVWDDGIKEFYKNEKLVRIEHSNGTYEVLNNKTGCWSFCATNGKKIIPATSPIPRTCPKEQK